MPTVKFKDLQIVNFTIHTWDVDRAVLNATGQPVALTTVTNNNRQSNNREQLSWMSKVNASLPAAVVTQESTEGINLTGSKQSQTLAFAVSIKRSEGKPGLLYGFQGQITTGSPSKSTMVVSDINVAVIPDNGDAAILIPAECPAAVQRSGGGVTLPAAPRVVSCSFRYNMTQPVNGAATTIITAASSSSGKKFLGQTVPVNFSPVSGVKVTVKNLGECAVVNDELGVEGDDGLQGGSAAVVGRHIDIFASSGMCAAVMLLLLLLLQCSCRNDNLYHPVGKGVTEQQIIIKVTGHTSPTCSITHTTPPHAERVCNVSLLELPQTLFRRNYHLHPSAVMLCCCFCFPSASLQFLVLSVDPS